MRGSRSVWAAILAAIIGVAAVAAGAVFAVRGLNGGSSQASSFVPPMRSHGPVLALSSGSGTPKYVVLLVLDGGRPDYFQTPNIPHIRALMNGGTQYTNAITGILESETPSGHATIGSGSWPKDTGILGFGWAGDGDNWVTLFDKQRVIDGMIGSVMTRNAAPTLASLLHRRYPDDRVAAMGGYKYYANDALGGPDADISLYFGTKAGGGFGPKAFPGHVPAAGVLSAPGLTAPSSHLPLGEGDHLAMKLAAATFQKTRQAVTMVNLPEFDQPLGHVYGAERDPKDVATLMHGLDADVGMLEQVYREAGVLDRTLFVLTADHGFLAFDRQVPKSVITDAVTKAGGHIISDTYHTGAYLWLTANSDDAAVAASVAAVRNPYIQSVYYRQEHDGGVRYVLASAPSLFKTKAAMKANQFLLSTFAGPTSPDLVVLFVEGVAGNGNPTLHWKGDHGGADWQAQHVPLIMAGQGVKAGRVSSYPAQLIDIAPTVLSLMGASSGDMRGTPLADAMTSPSGAWVAAQQTNLAKRAAIVSAMKTESRLELAAQRR